MSNREQYMPGTAAGADIRKGRRDVDARSRPRPPPPTGEGLEGADRARAPSRMGAVRFRPEPRCRRRREALDGGSHAAGHRDPGEAGRRAQGCSSTAGADSDLRWELEPLGGGTRLTLWHNIDRGFISMGAAGWHICFDVLDRFLAGQPIGRIVGPEAMKFGGWQRLNAEYAKQFGVELPDAGRPPWKRRCRSRPSPPAEPPPKPRRSPTGSSPRSSACR